MISEEGKIYFEQNKRGIVFFYDSIDDYIVSRFLINKGFLREGLIFASQSIEKILKSFILLEKGTLPKNNDRHNPLILKNILKKTSKLNLDIYDNFLGRLFGHYQSRYMENEDQLSFKSSSELKDIDGFYLFLLENISLKDEFKYGSRFFQYLFSDSQDVYGFALKQHNDILIKKTPQFKEKWDKRA